MKSKSLPDKQKGESMEQWDQWGIHILEELKRLSIGIEDMKTDLSSLKQEIAMLKVKSGVWGCIGALIPITITIVIWFATK